MVEMCAECGYEAAGIESLAHDCQPNLPCKCGHGKGFHRYGSAGCYECGCLGFEGKTTVRSICDDLIRIQKKEAAQGRHCEYLADAIRFLLQAIEKGAA